jgi:glycerol dehydrogenase
MHSSLHGEQVAFGLLVHFVLENRPLAFMNDLLGFFRRVGLPMCLADLGLKEIKTAHLELIATRVLYKGSHVYNMPMHIEAANLTDAILEADSLGRAYSSHF